MIKKTLVYALMLSTTFMSGCDYFKNKKEVKDDGQAVESEWSCTNPDNIKQVERFLKSEYLKQLEKDLRYSHYEANQTLLKTITDNIKFKIQNVTTLTDNPATAKNLACSSELVIVLPKGLQKRAENAFLEQPCGDCEGEEGDYSALTLRDYLEAGDSNLVIGDDQLKGAFAYDITKTDKEGLILGSETQNAVIDGVVLVTTKAVQYEAYVKENKDNQESSEKYDQERQAQMVLAQKAMDIRNKELDADQSKSVERLNQTWDRLSDEQKEKMKQNQSDWFEKRDVDCKVLAQRNVYQIPENEREIYQKHSDYWNEAMIKQNEKMQYTACFTQKTNERIVYLQNFFN